MDGKHGLYVSMHTKKCTLCSIPIIEICKKPHTIRRNCDYRYLPIFKQTGYALVWCSVTAAGFQQKQRKRTMHLNANDALCLLLV